jgi:hypothetical protein
VLFEKRLRERIRRGRIRCTIRVWMLPHVRVGGRYAMDEGEVEVQSIESITEGDLTDDLARESGFDDVADLMRTARHGHGRNIYLIRFRYLPAGASTFNSRRTRRRLHAESGTGRNK